MLDVSTGRMVPAKDSGGNLLGGSGQCRSSGQKNDNNRIKALLSGQMEPYLEKNDSKRPVDSKVT